MIQVNVCHGFGCECMLKCRISDFNYQPQPGQWSRHFQSPRTGDACEHFEPIKSYRMRPWGEGAETND